MALGLRHSEHRVGHITKRRSLQRHNRVINWLVLWHTTFLISINYEMYNSLPSIHSIPHPSHRTYLQVQQELSLNHGTLL